MKLYEVEYYYYQYNSGMADNGYKTNLIRTNSLSEAIEIVMKIKKSSNETLNDLEQSTDAILDYIPYSGYFTKPPTIYEIEKKQII